MINTVSTFVQYLENNKIPGYHRVVGFIIQSGVPSLQFHTYPTISEWLAICKVWSDVFEQNRINLHIHKI